MASMSCTVWRRWYHRIILERKRLWGTIQGWQCLWWSWFFRDSICISSSVLRRGQRGIPLYNVGFMFVVVGRFHGWLFLCWGRQVKFSWNQNFQIGMCVPVVLVGVWMNRGDLGWFHVVSGDGTIIWVLTWNHRKSVHKWIGFPGFVLRVQRHCANDCVVVRVGNWLDFLWRCFLGLLGIHCLGFVVLVHKRCDGIFECFDPCVANGAALTIGYCKVEMCSYTFQ